MSDLWFVAGSNVAIATLLGSLAFLVARRQLPALAHLLYVLALLKLVTPPLFDVEVWTAAELDIPASRGHVDCVGPPVPSAIIGGGAAALPTMTRPWRAKPGRPSSNSTATGMYWSAPPISRRRRLDTSCHTATRSGSSTRRHRLPESCVLCTPSSLCQRALGSGDCRRRHINRRL